MPTKPLKEAGGWEAVDQAAAMIRPISRVGIHTHMTRRRKRRKEKSHHSQPNGIGEEADLQNLAF